MKTKQGVMIKLAYPTPSKNNADTKHKCMQCKKLHKCFKALLDFWMTIVNFIEWSILFMFCAYTNIPICLDTHYCTLIISVMFCLMHAEARGSIHKQHW